MKGCYLVYLRPPHKCNPSFILKQLKNDRHNINNIKGMSTMLMKAWFFSSFFHIKFCVDQKIFISEWHLTPCRSAMSCDCYREILLSVHYRGVRYSSVPRFGSVRFRFNWTLNLNRTWTVDITVFWTWTELEHTIPELELNLNLTMSSVQVWFRVHEQVQVQSRDCLRFCVNKSYLNNNNMNNSNHYCVMYHLLGCPTLLL